MSKRKTWTPQQMLDMAQLLDSPPYGPRLIDDVKSALEYAAGLIEAADRLVDEASLKAKRYTGGKQP